MGQEPPEESLFAAAALAATLRLSAGPGPAPDSHRGTPRWADGPPRGRPRPEWRRPLPVTVNGVRSGLGGLAGNRNHRIQHKPTTGSLRRPASQEVRSGAISRLGRPVPCRPGTVALCAARRNFYAHLQSRHVVKSRRWRLAHPTQARPLVCYCRLSFRSTFWRNQVNWSGPSVQRFSRVACADANS